MGGKKATGEARRARRRHRQAGTPVEEPGPSARLAAGAGAPRRTRRPPALVREGPSEYAARKRVLILARMPQAWVPTGQAPQNEADGAAVLGRPEALGAADVARASGRAHRPAGKQERPRGKQERRTPGRVHGTRTRRATTAPLNFSAGFAGPPAIVTERPRPERDSAAKATSSRRARSCRKRHEAALPVPHPRSSTPSHTMSVREPAAQVRVPGSGPCSLHRDPRGREQRPLPFWQGSTAAAAAGSNPRKAREAERAMTLS